MGSQGQEMKFDPLLGPSRGIVTGLETEVHTAMRERKITRKGNAN